MKNVPNSKYISPCSNGGYRIRYKNKHYGWFKKLSDAMIARDELVNADWSFKFKKVTSTGEKYITFVGEKYAIKKRINNITKHFGVYDTLEEAKLVRDALIGANWPYVQKYAMKYPKYIKHTKKKKFQIHKMLDGKIETFGTFPTLESAVHERNLLMNADWDYENILNEI